MTDLRQTLKAGSLLLIETGEYSAHQVGAPVRVLKDIVMHEVAEEFRVGWKMPTSNQLEDRPDCSNFLSWLVHKGYVEDAGDTYRWHVGSYGEFEP